MKVIIAISSLQGGGAERVVVWLANRLTDLGHDVILMTYHSPVNDVYKCNESVERINFQAGKYFNSCTVSAFINLFRWRSFIIDSAIEYKADVFLSFIDGMNIYCLFSLLGKKIPIVVCERTDPDSSNMSNNKKKVRPFLYKYRANAVVFQTQKLNDKFAQRWNLLKTYVIPNAVRENLSFYDEGKIINNRVVLSVGRLDDQKGHDILINAWKKILPNNQQWKLRIVGDGVNFNKYKKMIDDFNLADSIELVGFTHDVNKEYENSNVFVLPSRVEGFPNALIEAMSHGNAVIASSIPDACSEIINEKINGLLFDGSPDDLAEKLNLLFESEELRICLAKNASKISQRFSEDLVLSKWNSLLSDVVN